MTREEAIETLKENFCAMCAYGSQSMMSCDIRGCDNRDAIKALEKEPCEDCISRQAVEEITWEMPNYTDALNVLTEVRDKVRVLPSVTPQQKVGKWIRVDKDKLKCSECEIIHFIAQYTRSANINYCPNCGAKMEVEE